MNDKCQNSLVIDKKSQILSKSDIKLLIKSFEIKVIEFLR